jgi:homoaconitase/3-isopropylmalate dehydratase large subunit
MNKEELTIILEGLIKRYIEDKDLSDELIKSLEPSKVKYILGELDTNKSKDYDLEDRCLIKDIYFYYC